MKKQPPRKTVARVQRGRIAAKSDHMMGVFSSFWEKRKRPKFRPEKQYRSPGDAPASLQHTTRPSPQSFSVTDDDLQRRHESGVQPAIPPRVRQETFNQTGERANLISSLDYAFNPNRSLTQCDFIYDIVIFTGRPRGQISRRLLIDFETDYNVMGDDVQKRIDTTLDPYYGDVIQLPGRPDVKPIGTVQVKWRLYEGVRVNTTTFMVIMDSDFDVLLGRPSVEEHNLFRTDPEIARRLEHSKKSIPMRT